MGDTDMHLTVPQGAVCRHDSRLGWSGWGVVWADLSDSGHSHQNPHTMLEASAMNTSAMSTMGASALCTSAVTNTTQLENSRWSQWTENDRIRQVVPAQSSAPTVLLEPPSLAPPMLLGALSGRIDSSKFTRSERTHTRGFWSKVPGTPLGTNGPASRRSSIAAASVSSGLRPSRRNSPSLVSFQHDSYLSLQGHTLLDLGPQSSEGASSQIPLSEGRKKRRKNKKKKAESSSSGGGQLENPMLVVEPPAAEAETSPDASPKEQGRDPRPYRGVVLQVGTEPTLVIDGVGELRFSYRNVKRKSNEKKVLLEVGDIVECRLTVTTPRRPVAIRRRRNLTLESDSPASSPTDMLTPQTTMEHHVPPSPTHA